MFQIIKVKTVDQMRQQSLKIYHKQLSIRFMICFALIVIVNFGCKKFVEIDAPPTNISQLNVFDKDQTATSVLTDIYVRIAARSLPNISKYTGLLSDEFSLWSGADAMHFGYFTNGLIANSTTNTGNETWNLYYGFIFQCNMALEGLSASTNLTPSVKQQLLGEAHFVRAWLYFYLVNLYGDLPMAIGSDPKINIQLSRSPSANVYKLIIDDLLKSQELLNSNYVNGQLTPYSSAIPERVRPTQWAANALLARVYLYSKEYGKAEIEASKVINNTQLFGLLTFPNVFLKNSRETIWQLQPRTAGWNTEEARAFHLSAAPAGLSSSKPVYLNSFLMSAFEPNDQRRRQWVDSLISGSNKYYFSAKYKVGAQNSSVTSPAALTEYSMMLRLSEQYLIRAEARARQDNLQEAIADLDLIRNRAGLPLIANTSLGISQSTLLAVILHERQVELFSEWGHRWFDLKRFGKVNEVMSIVTPVKGGTWQSTDQLLPIPYNDLVYGPNLNQNAGY